jgi:four helix bundle protein
MAVYRNTNNFPASERYGLQSQMRRAAVSVAANIVEGCARDGEAEYRRFLEIAFSSAREVIYFTSVAQRLQFLPPDAASTIEQLGNRAAAALVALRASLRS